MIKFVKGSKKKKEVILFLILLIVSLFAGFKILSTPRETSQPLEIQKKIFASPTFSPSPTSSEPTPSTSPAANPSPNLTSMEEKVKGVVSDFEQTYKSQDKTKIFSFFTGPQIQEEKDTHSRLLSGKDVQGIPGGPELFVSNSASEIPLSYQLKATNKISDNKYQIKISEERASTRNLGSKFTRERSLTLVLVNSSWLVDRYENPNYPSKYSGFLN